MASSSNQTLPSPSVEENNPADLELDDFADILSLFNNANVKEIPEEIKTDPEFIRLTQELHRSTPTSRIELFESSEYNKMVERFHNYLMENRQIRPIEDLGNTGKGAFEKLAECVGKMEKDPELKPILAEIDATGPAAFLKFWDDKDVLKKLSKASCAAILGDLEEGFINALESGGDEDEEISEGRKVLKIICEHAYMKNIKVLQRLNAKNKLKTRRSHHASNSEMEHGHAVLQNRDNETLIDVDNSTSIDDVA